MSSVLVFRRAGKLLMHVQAWRQACDIRSKIRPRFLESPMNDGWIALLIVCAVLIGALMPLLRKDRPSDVPPPRRETLRDWRNGE